MCNEHISRNIHTSPTTVFYAETSLTAVFPAKFLNMFFYVYFIANFDGFCTELICNLKSHIQDNADLKNQENYSPRKWWNLFHENKGGS
jgi:hypothetical protein